MTHIVRPQDLKACMKKLRDLRAWSNSVRMDPWAFRQMLVFALVIDTWAARESGISPEALEEFDNEARKDAAESLEERKEKA